MPLRVYLYHCDTIWTEEGCRLSWRMMLRAKQGTVHYKVVGATTQQTWYVDPATILSPYDAHTIAAYPGMMRQFALYLKQDFAKKGFGNVCVYAISSVSLNNWPAKPLIDSTVDLTIVRYPLLSHAQWITPGH